MGVSERARWLYLNEHVFHAVVDSLATLIHDGRIDREHLHAAVDLAIEKADAAAPEIPDPSPVVEGGVGE